MIDYQNLIGHQTIHSWTGGLSWNHNTRNDYWAPTRGGQITASIDGALPGSTVQFWRFTGEANHYWPVGKGFVLYLDGQVGYGQTYGKDDNYAFPFWDNYYSGGVRDVRGFQDNTLGPRVCVGTQTDQATGKIVPITPNSNGSCTGSVYSYAQPIGGNFKVLGTAELYLPLPFLKDVNTARVSWFVDVGNTYNLGKGYANYSQYGIQSGFDASTLRASTGLSLHWQAPIGPLIISFAIPFRKQASDGYYEERIQFTFGSTF
jgi:outer membrane protein insertion porin family